MPNELAKIDTLKNQIFTIRGKRVMLDRDLAELYRVPTYRLNEAVKRNIKRFPDDFMFKLNNDELKELIANCDRFKTLKHSTNPPYAFTGHGVAMLSSVLKSDRAIEINIQIMRAFIALRQLAVENQELANRIAQIEHFLIAHVKENKADFKQVYELLNLLMDRTKPASIGFKTE